jgi:hypothetical protein
MIDRSVNPKFVKDGSSVIWDCPGCKEWHSVPVEGPQAWGFNGDLLHPTLTPSVLYNKDLRNKSRPLCHIFLRDGVIEFLGDCTHEMAGKKVPLSECEDV